MTGPERSQSRQVAPEDPSLFGVEEGDGCPQHSAGLAPLVFVCPSLFQSRPGKLFCIRRRQPILSHTFVIVECNETAWRSLPTLYFLSRNTDYSQDIS